MRVAQLSGMRYLYRPGCQTKGSRLPRLTPARCSVQIGQTPTFEGHSSLQVTMDRYGHLFKSDDHKEAMDMIAAALLLA